MFESAQLTDALPILYLLLFSFSTISSQYFTRSHSFFWFAANCVHCKTHKLLINELNLPYFFQIPSKWRIVYWNRTKRSKSFTGIRRNAKCFSFFVCRNFKWMSQTINAFAKKSLLVLETKKPKSNANFAVSRIFENDILIDGTIGVRPISMKYEEQLVKECAMNKIEVWKMGTKTKRKKSEKNSYTRNQTTTHSRFLIGIAVWTSRTQRNMHFAGSLFIWRMPESGNRCRCCPTQSTIYFDRMRFFAGGCCWLK